MTDTQPAPTFMLGRTPKREDPRTLKLASYLTPASVPMVNWITTSGATVQWPMYGNDQVGDCCFAGVGHMLGCWSVNESGTELVFKDPADPLAWYSAVTGYNPADPSTDQGANLLDVLNYWRKTGFNGHKIVAYAEVNMKDLAEVKTAVSLFGGIYAGFNFPTTAMDKFNSGQPWDVVPGATIDGGHCVPILSDDLECITWAKAQAMTPAFLSTYFDEGYAIITPEWLAKNGTDPQGLDLAALTADLADITNPPDVPGPAPTPPAPPAPQPPAPDPQPPAPGPVPPQPEPSPPSTDWPDDLAGITSERVRADVLRYAAAHKVTPAEYLDHLLGSRIIEALEHFYGG